MRTSKAERQYRLIENLKALGFTYEEARALRRIEMTLSRWSEHECNGNIQRDGENSDGRPRWYSSYTIENDTHPRGRLIPDREKGALNRLAKIIAVRNSRIAIESAGRTDAVNGGQVEAYHQGDPRGCALYIVKTSDLNGSDINSTYTRGIAVCD